MNFVLRNVKVILPAIALGTIMLVNPVFAEGPGWISNSQITELVVTGDGGLNVRLGNNLTNCVSNSGYGPGYASVYPDHPGLSKITALLMTAYVSGKSVSLYFSDNTCKVSEVIVSGN